MRTSSRPDDFGDLVLGKSASRGASMVLYHTSTLSYRFTIAIGSSKTL